MPRTVISGMTIIRVGACSTATPFSSIERMPSTMPTAAITTAATRKKVEAMMAMPTVSAVPLIAPGAERPTPTIASEKAGRSCAK
ncbi:hypothetical protein HC022_12525, partial [Salipiger sp. HF18]|uniref:hypothetical protein n=1 Tax=Salipiger sp. HF18 TaxID=2721557 RepID=UPI00142DAA14